MMKVANQMNDVALAGIGRDDATHKQ